MLVVKVKTEAGKKENTGQMDILIIYHPTLKKKNTKNDRSFKKL